MSGYAGAVLRRMGLPIRARHGYPKPAAPSSDVRLSPRQMQCLRLLAEGYTYNEIGVRVGVSYGRVNNVLRAAYERLDVASGTSCKSAIDAFRALGWLRVP